jgi:glutamine synthetase
VVRIPSGNGKSTRIEIRSVAPDANPYLVLYTLMKTGLEGEKISEKIDLKKARLRFLPGTINDAIRVYKASDFITKIMGENSKEKYLEPKQASADRNPKELGSTIKESEIIYHHEVTNQSLWNGF